jgi:hypothetical protein
MQLRTPEEVTLREYRLVQLAAATPVGIGARVGVRGLARLVSEAEPEIQQSIPASAILCFFHPEQILSAVCRRFWQQLAQHRVIGVGFHGFTSYVTSFAAWPGHPGWSAFRYTRGTPDRPFEQLRRYLAARTEGLVAIGTDAGGPFFRVRSSLIRLAIETGRPVVGVRHRATRAPVLWHHAVPTPASRIWTTTTPVFAAGELAQLDVTAATQQVQEAMELAMRRLEERR